MTAKGANYRTWSDMKTGSGSWMSMAAGSGSRVSFSIHGGSLAGVGSGSGSGLVAGGRLWVCDRGRCGEVLDEL